MEKNIFKGFFDNFDMKKFGLNKLILIVLAGILLLIIKMPLKKNNNNSNIFSENDIQIDKEEFDNYSKYVEDKLKDILEKSYGVGTIDVMVSVKESKNTNNSYFSENVENTNWYVDGVLIVANVGSNESAVAEISQGVAAVFNLPIHKVAVIKKDSLK